MNRSFTVKIELGQTVFRKCSALKELVRYSEFELHSCSIRPRPNIRNIEIELTTSHVYDVRSGEINYRRFGRFRRFGHGTHYNDL